MSEAFPFISPTFEEVALRLFRFQAQHNPVYGTWLQHLGVDLARQEAVQSLHDIPFLPIETFKNACGQDGAVRCRGYLHL